jgi:PhoPQ-activated pathogenicity-related protein
VGAVDPRVALIVPIVMDELNFVQNIHHHFKSYGGWTFALKDYTELNFTRCLDHPNTQALMDIVDPCVRYSYSRPARF